MFYGQPNGTVLPSPGQKWNEVQKLWYMIFTWLLDRSYKEVIERELA